MKFPQTGDTLTITDDEGRLWYGVVGYDPSGSIVLSGSFTDCAGYSSGSVYSDTGQYYFNPDNLREEYVFVNHTEIIRNKIDELTDL